MNRCVVSVATTPHYQKGMARLESHQTNSGKMLYMNEPAGSPKHSEVPYAFKAYALHQAAASYDVLLWADACIRPIRSMEPLWERIERDGYWFSHNGWSNYEWTADSAYADLFGGWYTPLPGFLQYESAAETNRTIPHVVATTFGVNIKHSKGKAFLDEYFRLASETKAFCGPWWNEKSPHCPGHHEGASRFGNCGPSDVRGHRHDQTAASVIAWRLGFELTNPPDIFSYVDGQSESTILVADGAY